MYKNPNLLRRRNSPFIQTSTFDGPFYWPAMLDAAADIYNGFVFWSNLTSVGLLVWYFPLWHMGLSGYEAIIMVSLSPVFLGIPAIKSLVIKNIRLVHLASLVGLLAWNIKDPANRLFTVGLSVFLGCWAWPATWYAERKNSARLQARILAWSAGLILSSISKFANGTNNPIWPILNSSNGGWNKTGFVLAVAAVWKSTQQVTTSGGDYEAPNTKKGSSLLTGLGIGGLLFALQSLLSDSSTMILWVWEGFPVQGLCCPTFKTVIHSLQLRLLVGCNTAG